MDSNLQQIVNLCGLVDAELSAKDGQIAALQQSANQSSSLAVLTELQAYSGTTESTGWKQPGNAGDTGGPNPGKQGGVFTVKPGPVATFSAKGSYPYNNGYFYMKFPGFQTAARFLYEFWIQFPTASDLAACNALEFELQQSLGGLIYNMAWQIQKPSSILNWRLFDKVNRRWVPSTAVNDPYAWHGAVWVKIAAAFVRNPDKTMTHATLSMNDKLQLVNVTQPALAQPESDYLSVGFQLDTNGMNPPTPYSVNVQRMRVTWSS